MSPPSSALIQLIALVLATVLFHRYALPSIVN